MPPRRSNLRRGAVWTAGRLVNHCRLTAHGSRLALGVGERRLERGRRRRATQPGGRPLPSLEHAPCPICAAARGWVPHGRPGAVRRERGCRRLSPGHPETRVPWSAPSSVAVRRCRGGMANDPSNPNDGDDVEDESSGSDAVLGVATLRARSNEPNRGN